MFFSVMLFNYDCVLCVVCVDDDYIVHLNSVSIVVQMHGMKVRVIIIHNNVRICIFILTFVCCICMLLTMSYVLIVQVQHVNYINDGRKRMVVLTMHSLSGQAHIRKNGNTYVYTNMHIVKYKIYVNDICIEYVDEFEILLYDFHFMYTLIIM